MVGLNHHRRRSKPTPIDVEARQAGATTNVKTPLRVITPTRLETPTSSTTLATPRLTSSTATSTAKSTTTRLTTIITTATTEPAKTITRTTEIPTPTVTVFVGSSEKTQTVTATASAGTGTALDDTASDISNSTTTLPGLQSGQGTSVVSGPGAAFIIVVGILGALSLIGIAGIVFWRRRKQQAQTTDKEKQEATAMPN
ncbi:hypothetical protein GQ53DRAFT_837957 [Thozetella sp. PMI_491]|nr:hypothetical protein GQ53DRAFT_837957 [Thozetella sp. PMI_491]